MIPATLTGDRIVLSMPVASDIDSVAEYCTDPLFERFLTLPWPYTWSDAESFVLGHVPASWADGTECTWAIRDEADGPLLGVISWRPAGDLGFWMGLPHRRMGYMSEATAIVCDWVFAADAGVDQIRWEATAGNLGSAHVAHNAGFRFTGVAPLGHPARDGSHPDGWHAVLRREDDRDRKDGWPL